MEAPVLGWACMLDNDRHLRRAGRTARTSYIQRPAFARVLRRHLVDVVLVDEVEGDVQGLLADVHVGRGQRAQHVHQHVLHHLPVPLLQLLHACTIALRLTLIHPEAFNSLQAAFLWAHVLVQPEVRSQTR